MKQNDNEFMQHDLRLPELTVRGMLLGAILTVIFTASNVYPRRGDFDGGPQDGEGFQYP